MIRQKVASDLNVDRDVAALVVKVGNYPLYHGGVDAIRSLGRLEVPVYAVSEDRWTPAALSGAFESSVPGVYFTGLASAATFGPLMRFVCGSGFAARRVSSAVAGRIRAAKPGVAYLDG
jgi:hypothetical protein